MLSYIYLMLRFKALGYTIIFFLICKRSENHCQSMSAFGELNIVLCFAFQISSVGSLSTDFQVNVFNLILIQNNFHVPFIQISLE